MIRVDISILATIAESHLGPREREELAAYYKPTETAVNAVDKGRNFNNEKNAGSSTALDRKSPFKANRDWVKGAHNF